MQQEEPSASERLVGVSCTACREPLIFAAAGVGPAEPYCPLCWQKLAIAQYFSFSIRVAIASGELRAVMERVARQSNRTVLGELKAVEQRLDTISEALATVAWACQ